MRSIKVCYDQKTSRGNSKARDITVFSVQLELWSRSTRESEWLNTIGHPALLQKIEEGESDCDIHTPTKDYVVTELFAMYR